MFKLGQKYELSEYHWPVEWSGNGEVILVLSDLGYGVLKLECGAQITVSPREVDEGVVKLISEPGGFKLGQKYRVLPGSLSLATVAGMIGEVVEVSENQPWCVLRFNRPYSPEIIIPSTDVVELVEDVESTEDAIIPIPETNAPTYETHLWLQVTHLDGRVDTSPEPEGEGWEWMGWEQCAGKVPSEDATDTDASKCFRHEYRNFIIGLQCAHILFKRYRRELPEKEYYQTYGSLLLGSCG